MSGAMAARAATPDRGGAPGGGGAEGSSGGVFGNRLVDYAGEREGLLGDAPGGGPNPYARGGGGGAGAYRAEPVLPPMPQPPAPTVAVALPFVANARGAYARAPTTDNTEAEEALEPYSDVHPAMRADAAAAAAAPPAGENPFRDVHPALRERTAYDPGRATMLEDDKEIAPGRPG
jgi:hypothetical protein